MDEETKNVVVAKKKNKELQILIWMIVSLVTCSAIPLLLALAFGDNLFITTCHNHKYETFEEISEGKTVSVLRCFYCKISYDCGHGYHNYDDNTASGGEYKCRECGSYYCNKFGHKFRDKKCLYCKIDYDCKNFGHKWIEAKVPCREHQKTGGDLCTKSAYIDGLACQYCNVVYDCSKYGHRWSGCSSQPLGRRHCKGKCLQCGMGDDGRGTGCPYDHHYISSQSW